MQFRPWQSKARNPRYGTHWNRYGRKEAGAHTSLCSEVWGPRKILEAHDRGVLRAQSYRMDSE
jgi:hypothetical protein